ncbi:MAG: hypothetical protein MI806_12425 [Minwuiales bacterium]|nr:hypothetical protein [Minwuiales bacterium]
MTAVSRSGVQLDHNNRKDAIDEVDSVDIVFMCQYDSDIDDSTLFIFSI